MHPASDYDLIPLAGPSAVALACWQAYDPVSRVELHSTAIQINARLIFIDPIPLQSAAVDRLVAHAQPAGIILTNANHARAAEEYRQRFSIPVRAAADAVADLGLHVDEVLPDGGEHVFDALQILPLTGAATGEIAVYCQEGGGVMVIGDALIDLPGYGFTFLPPKYCTDPRALRRSLRTLLGKPFNTLTFAHGAPIVADAHGRLAALLGGEARR